MQLLNHTTFSWLLIIVICLCGFGASRCGKAWSLRRLLGITLTVLVGDYSWGWWWAETHHSTIWLFLMQRSLGVALKVLLVGGLAISLGYLPGQWWRLRCFGQIGLRQLQQQSGVLFTTVSSLAVFGVALGVWLIVVCTGILSGFEQDLTARMVGPLGHITAASQQFGGSFGWDERQQVQLQQQAATTAVCSYVHHEVVIASRHAYTGAMLFGVDLPKCQPVLQLQASKQDANWLPSDWQQGADGHGVPLLIGLEMAKTLQVEVGDGLRVVSPTHWMLSPMGVIPKSMAAFVAGIYASKTFDSEVRYAYGDMAQWQLFLQIRRDEISGLSVLLEQPEHAEAISNALRQNLSLQHLQWTDWQTRNRTLFSALALEKWVAFVVLGFVVLVGNFAICNTLFMMVLRKKKDIAILASMGAQVGDIAWMFLSQGLAIGGVGSLLGGALGLLSLQGLRVVGLPMPSELYYIDALPVHISLTEIVGVVGLTLCLVWNFSFYPSKYGAQLQVVEGLLG